MHSGPAGRRELQPKGKDDGGDPKRALRIAFAKTGRLTQFIEPEDSKDSPEIARASPSATSCASSVSYPNRHAIRAASTPRSAIGLKVYNSGNGKARASFPLRPTGHEKRCRHRAAPSYLTEAYRTGAPSSSSPG
ncbi:MAG: hypothetical protein ACLT98_00170 [Eggerthellaceae bacterium]